MTMHYNFYRHSVFIIFYFIQDVILSFKVHSEKSRIILHVAQLQHLLLLV